MPCRSSRRTSTAWQRHGLNAFTEGRSPARGFVGETSWWALTTRPTDTTTGVVHFNGRDVVDFNSDNTTPTRMPGNTPSPTTPADVMKEIHALFAGKGTEEAVLKAAEEGEGERLRNHRCYAHLYLGLYYEALGDNAKAKDHILKSAIDYASAMQAGFSGGVTAWIQDPDSNSAVGGTATLSATDVLLGGGAYATSAYIKLGNGGLLAGRKTPVTIELWATLVAPLNWGRIFDFGSTGGASGHGGEVRVTLNGGAILTTGAGRQVGQQQRRQQNQRLREELGVRGHGRSINYRLGRSARKLLSGAGQP